MYFRKNIKYKCVVATLKMILLAANIFVCPYVDVVYMVLGFNCRVVRQSSFVKLGDAEKQLREARRLRWVVGGGVLEGLPDR